VVCVSRLSRAFRPKAVGLWKPRGECCLMAAMEPVDGSATSVFGLLAEVPCERPDQPRRDGLEDGAGERPLAADRDHDTAFAEPVFDRKIARQVATSGPACDAT
jgi:hypothetical protein